MKKVQQLHSTRKSDLIKSINDNKKDKNTKNVAKKLLPSLPKNLPKNPE